MEVEKSGMRPSTLTETLNLTLTPTLRTSLCEIGGGLCEAEWIGDEME